MEEIKQEKPYRRFNLQLIFTEQCNLRCRYCFEIGKGQRKMPVALAKEILDRELSRQPDDVDRYQIDLVGGEPFLDFGDIRELIEYAIANEPRWGKGIFFNIGTNMTLLDDEIKKWLVDNKRLVMIGTSLDGTKAAHDHYRCSSYDAVVEQLPFYKKLYPEQGLKMTLGPDTLGSMYEGVLNIEALGFGMAVNVAFEPLWGDLESKKRHLRTFAEQLDRLVTHYAEHPGLTVPNILSMTLTRIIQPRDEEPRWCGSGVHMRAYDTDGRPLPCHRFSRFCTEQIYEGQESVKPRQKTKCDSCEFLGVCPTCYGYNWQVTGNPDTRTSYHCEFIKLQLLARAKLIVLRNQDVIGRLANNPDEISSVPGRVLAELKAADYVIRHFRAEEIIENCEHGYPPATVA